MVEYSKEVMDHFLKPHNMGEIKEATIVGQVGNPVCGDIIKVFLKISKNEAGEEYIEDIKFKTLGCASAIATSSMITDLAKGKTLKEALEITRNDVADSLGGLPPIKMHCSNLAADALHKAINDYLHKETKLDNSQHKCCDKDCSNCCQNKK